jgi:sugar/nucleoside kinase (ribokinase family)
MEIIDLEPIDYLVIGHITVDQTPEGPCLGGTAVYASLTAKALGYRTGVVTCWGAELPLDALQGIPVASFKADYSTIFENIYTTDEGRIQILHSVAPGLEYYHVPETWRSASVVHLGPVAQEINPSLVRNFPSAFIGLTPQGWMRGWESDGRVYVSEWPEASFVLERANAAVISLEDVDYDERRVDEMAASCHVMAVTEGSSGVRLYWNGDVRWFPSPRMTEVDSTGAGDIFAAAFFTRLYATRDPWEAARFATQLGAFSVTRPGLSGIPTPEEIETCMVEVR